MAAGPLQVRLPMQPYFLLPFFFFNDTATTEIYTLSLHDALPISERGRRADLSGVPADAGAAAHPQRPRQRSEEHTSELQSQSNLVCRLLLEKKKNGPRNSTGFNVSSPITETSAARDVSSASGRSP